MFKNIFLYTPFLIFFLALAVDRILVTDSIRAYYTKTVSELNFLHKPELFTELKEYLQKKDRKKVLVFFGNSRSLLFDNEVIAKKYPEWILFNFSVPGGTPDYFLYWLLKFKEQNIRPDFIIVDSAIEAFNLTATIKIDESINNGLDIPFVWKYRERFSKEELTEFIAKRMFRTYQYRPKILEIYNRAKNKGEILNNFLFFRGMVTDNLRRNRGSASGDFAQNRTSSENIIADFARGDYNSYLSPYNFHEEKIKFQEDILVILNELAVPHAGIWVRVAPLYFNLIQNKKQKQKDNTEKSVLEIWKPRIFSMYKIHNTEIWNMNEGDFSCAQFTDASHMATACFPDYLEFIFKRLK
ncbi:MAG: DUF1574 domain-containing protein [Leptospiraceae bacterium]|nr:DUF1574 domain-containing protein [Leptospiraceae bacterium]